MNSDTAHTVYFSLFALIAFILVGSFLSILESTITKVKTLYKEEEYKENTIISKIANNTDHYYISIYFLKILVVILTSFHFYKNLISYLDFLNNLQVAVSAVVLTFIIISVCDVIPKKIALFNEKKPSFITLIYIISLILSPISIFINFFNNLILKIFHSNSKEFEEKVSEEEIKALVETASEKGVFNDIEKEMINSIFSFDDITAKDIMISRKDTYKIDIDEPLNEYIDELLESYYTRIPVYKENIDDIIGILNIKDLILEARNVGFENIDIEKLIQKPYFVPEMKNIDELFKEMQKNRNHMAILVDEYGGFSGIVTIEDLIEQIMGDINDEHDDEEESIQKLSDNVYLINGTTEIREVNKELDLELENENYDTISALVIENLGYIPEEGEKPSVTIDNLLFKVELVSDNRIEKLKLIIKENPEEDMHEIKK
ncbi:CBS domain protein [[Eubacterium] yurii subsp. margaretiae ATCC 43715]|nr:CBS domain protein [[Eubacterium] yurii subsp. margaretiae ATCC 43715]